MVRYYVKNELNEEKEGAQQLVVGPSYGFDGIFASP